MFRWERKQYAARMVGSCRIMYIRGEILRIAFAIFCFITLTSFIQQAFTLREDDMTLPNAAAHHEPAVPRRSGWRVARRPRPADQAVI